MLGDPQCLRGPECAVVAGLVPGGEGTSWREIEGELTGLAGELGLEIRRRDLDAERARVVLAVSQAADQRQQ